MADVVSAQSSRSRRRWPAAVALAVVLIYLAVGALTAAKMTRPKRRFKPEHNPASRNLPYEEVRFAARGGDADLAGWFVPAAGSSRALILVHGKDSNRSRFIENSGAIAVELHRRAFNLLLIDLRGHGNSSESRLSFGIKEHRDILGAVDYLGTRGFRKGAIGVLGQSMGAASTLLATAAEPGIAAAVSDCAYSDIRLVIDRQFQQSTGLPSWFLPSTRLFGWLLTGVDLVAARPVQVVSQIAPRPLFLIHSGADALIPVGHAADLRLAAEGSRLWVIEGAAHVRGIQTAESAYQREVGDFFDRHVPKS